MTTTTEQDPMSALEPGVLYDLHRRMVRIRLFEEEAGKLMEARRKPGFLHLYVGQEAVAAGVMATLGQDDVVTSTHRGHGHAVAKGADLRYMYAELFGKQTGYCKGRGGSMHINDLSIGMLGANGIVGGGIPHAVGAALAAVYKGQDFVAVPFFGDGATNIGVFHESANLAAVLQLPVLFVCENNGYGEFTASDDVTAGHDPLGRGTVFDIPSELVDGMDVLAVRAAASRAVARARAGEGPSFLVCTTYRYSGHHVADKQDYKDAEEVRAWRQKDPILRLSRRLQDQGLASVEQIAAQEAEVEAEVRTAVEAGKAAELPGSGDLRSFLYA